MVCLYKSRLNLFLLVKNFIDHCFAVPYFAVGGSGGTLYGYRVTSHIASRRRKSSLHPHLAFCSVGDGGSFNMWCDQIVLCTALYFSITTPLNLPISVVQFRIVSSRPYTVSPAVCHCSEHWLKCAVWNPTSVFCSFGWIMIISLNFLPFNAISNFGKEVKWQKIWWVGRVWSDILFLARSSCTDKVE